MRKAQIAHFIRRAGPEARECYAFCQWFEAKYPGLWPALAHIPNERHSKIEAIVVKALGGKSGVSDYVLPVPLHGNVGMWLEFKASGKGWGSVSQTQRDWLDLMQSHGWFTAVAYGLDQGVEIATAYVEGDDLSPYWHGPLRGRRNKGEARSTSFSAI
ncbi:MAG: VRR-NUC domain-containing protein [Gammaproteobacteria bacterium]